jgi:hypothetical protein
MFPHIRELSVGLEAERTTAAKSVNSVCQFRFCIVDSTCHNPRKSVPLVGHSFSLPRQSRRMRKRCDNPTQNHFDKEA